MRLLLLAMLVAGAAANQQLCVSLSVSKAATELGVKSVQWCASRVEGNGLGGFGVSAPPSVAAIVFRLVGPIVTFVHLRRVNSDGLWWGTYSLCREARFAIDPVLALANQSDVCATAVPLLDSPFPLEISGPKSCTGPPNSWRNRAAEPLELAATLMLGGDVRDDQLAELEWLPLLFDVSLESDSSDSLSSTERVLDASLAEELLQRAKSEVDLIDWLCSSLLAHTVCFVGDGDVRRLHALVAATGAPVLLRDGAAASDGCATLVLGERVHSAPLPWLAGKRVVVLGASVLSEACVAQVVLENKRRRRHVGELRQQRIDAFFLDAFLPHTLLFPARRLAQFASANKAATLSTLARLCVVVSG